MRDRTSHAAGPAPLGERRSIARVLKAASTASIATTDVEQAVQWALDLVCEYTGWPLGHAFMVDDDNETMLPTDIWHDEDPDRYSPFVRDTRASRFRAGEGLPGRILASGEPTWITDVRSDPNFPRASVAIECGLGAGMGFPIRSSRGVEGVMEFFAIEPLPPEEDALDLIAHVGVQLGNLLDRARAQASLEASQARLRNLVELAPDALIVLDPHGRISLVNRAVERLSNYTREELVGGSMEVLVPEGLVAGKALWLRRRDGEQVAVDVSLSPIDFREGPVVVVAIRDISERERAIDALRTSEARLAGAERLARLGSWTWEVGDDFVVWSEGLYRVYGRDAGSGPVSFADYLGYVLPEDRERVAAAVERTLGNLAPYEHEYRIVRPDGRVRWVHARGEVAAEQDGNAVRLTGFCQDITEAKWAESRRQRAQEDLASHQRILELIARGQPLGHTLTALCLEIESRYPGGRCTVLLVDEAEQVLHHAAAPSMPPSFIDGIDGLPIADGMGACGTAVARGEVVIVEDTLSDPLTDSFIELAIAHDVRSVWSQPLVNASGELIGTFAIYRSVPHRPDRSERRTLTVAGSLAALAIERATNERALTAAAQIDPLTGLPNRAEFLDRLTQQLAEGESSVAVMFLDLDRFKWINDSLGHPAGDRILIDVATRLRGALLGRDVVARFGGDEFTMLIINASDEGLDAIASRVEGVFTDPFVLDGGEFFLSVSIGIARNDHDADAYGLVRDADAAMYAAKDSGRGRHVMFDERLRERAVARVTLETEIRRAIERDEFVMYYQPVQALPTRRWAGAEALARWMHPTRGLVPPDGFIPLAEDTGLIVPLGLRLMEKAVEQAAHWAAEDPTVHVAVNVSVVQLSDPMFATELGDLLRRHGLAPDLLTVEVTESTVMQHLAIVRAALEEIAGLGVHVYVDDFGTGYSSIARLGELPVAGIKVDRQFIARLGIDPNAGDVLAAIVDLGHALDLRVVAEGIETEAALDLVVASGCDYGQGFLFARPVPAADLRQLLSKA